MAPDQQPAAWLLLAAGEDRQYGGNSGYEDEIDVSYSWDSTVKNHGSVKPGDFIALWDKRRLLGVSVVEQVRPEDSRKQRFRCPVCGRANIQSRATKSPKYKCQKCGAEFDDPTIEFIDVVAYRSRHDAAWTPLEGLLGADALRRLCLSPRSQHSMRSLNWTAFASELEAHGATFALSRAVARAPDLYVPEFETRVSLPSGHTTATVRVRRGQQQFRRRLLEAQGNNCAFTGRAPERVLDAGHLYSYAELGEHHEHGGLLLRRDVHRLFDDGWIAVDPTSLKLDVSEPLGEYPQYATLHGEALRAVVSDQHLGWLEKHWREHRGNASTSIPSLSGPRQPPNPAIDPSTAQSESASRVMSAGSPGSTIR
ncbi:hypothetical protein QQX13_06035 [Demequina sp. SYSU T00068]|uniref:HNH endonuclease n=1 Tax=Demequina lignilytica TaxID=3051663 RepID=UPI002619E83F|nr:HNH endonuclease [Demequina sp. SYSU T00068]MDN4490388.1 hypothetical protein [Demequina sp. SYSU T00068]